MGHDQRRHSTKPHSPYPGLQEVLSQLSHLNDDGDDAAPVFDNKAKARLFIDIQEQEKGRRLQLDAVWDIDHADLNASQVDGWTVTRLVC